MNAMLPLISLPESRSAKLRRLSHVLWPAAATIALHGVVFGLLLGNWSPEPPAGAAQSVIKTQLVTITTAPEPTPEPPAQPVEPPTPSVAKPVAPPEPELAPEPEPVAEVEPTQMAKPEIDHAAIARKRAEEQRRIEQEELAQRQRQEQARIAEQQRLEEERQREQQRLEALAAEQARQQAQADAEQRQIAAAKKQAADSLSQYHPISKQPPAYPRRALDRRKEGDCTVEYTVTAQGTVENPSVVAGSCDDPIFVRPSLASAKSFRYQPRIVNGVAVAVPGVRNTFRFRLEQ